MKERLMKLMRAEGISAIKLAEITGVQPSTISHIMSGRNNPRFDFLTALVAHYPKLNARWLILGEGNMYLPEASVDIYKELSTPVEETPDMQSATSLEHKIEIPHNDDVATNHLANNELSPRIAEDKHIEKIAFFNSDGTFSVYCNSGV